MTKAISNRDIFYQSSAIMARTHALFTNFCVAWLNTPPPPPPLQYRVKVKTVNIIDVSDKFNIYFELNITFIAKMNY